MGQDKEHGLVFGQLVQPLDLKSVHHIWVKSSAGSAEHRALGGKQGRDKRPTMHIAGRRWACRAPPPPLTVRDAPAYVQSHAEKARKTQDRATT